MVTRAIVALLGFVGLFFMTNYLGKDVYGSIAYTMALVASFNSISDLGFTSAHIKKVSEGGDVGVCLRTFAAIKLVLNGAMAVVTLTAISIWSFYLGNPLSAATWNLLLLFLLYYLMYNMAGVIISHYTSTMEQAKIAVIQIFDGIVRVPLVIFVCVGGGGALGIAYAYVFASLSIMLVALFFIFRDRIRFKKKTLYRSYFKFAAPLMLVAIGGTLVGTMDKVIIGLNWGNGPVGLFQSSQALLSVLAIISSSVATMTFPSFSKLHSEGNIHFIRSMTKEAERYISILTVPFIIVIVMFPVQCAGLILGGDFAAAGEPMRFLALGVLLSMLNSIPASQILAVNRPGTSAKLTLMNFLVYLGLLVVLVPTNIFGIQMMGMSATGAAIAYFIAAAVLLVVTRYTVYKLTRTGVNTRLGLHLLAAILAGLALTVLSDYLPLSGWISIVIYGITSCAVFAAVLIALKELTRKDLDYFLDVINVKRMGSYMSDELRNKKK